MDGAIPTTNPSPPAPPRYLTHIVPFTAGGNKLPIARVGEFRTAHYSQNDTSLNDALWSLYPVEKNLEELKRREVNAKAACDRLIPPMSRKYDRNALVTGVPIHEHGRIAANLHTLRITYHRLLNDPTIDAEAKGDGRPAVDILLERKKLGIVEPLQTLLPRLHQLNEMSQCLVSKQYKLGMLKWCRALIDMYPWTATPLIFTHGEAFGLRIGPLEADLWSKLATGAVHLSTDDPSWAIVAKSTSWAGVSMRYNTHRYLSLAYQRWCKGKSLDKLVGQFIPPHLIFARALADPDLALRDLIVKIWAADPDDGSWAHEQCYNGHVTCVTPIEHVPSTRSGLPGGCFQLDNDGNPMMPFGIEE